MAVYQLQNLQGQSALTSYFEAFRVNFSSDATEALVHMPDDYLSIRVLIVVETPWSGGSATISIGTAASNGLLVSAASLAAATALSYNAVVHFDADTVVNAYLSHDSSTSGVASIYIEVLETSKYF